MNAQKKISLLLILLLVFACSTGDDPEPVEQVYVPKSEINSLENIPGLEKALLRYTMGSHSTENQLSINEDASGYLSKVDFKNIHSRMDSTGQTYYSMYMDLNPEDPFTFYNLVIGKRPNGEFAPPMLMTYQMSEGFKEKYLETGSLEGFEGSITRAYISQDGIGTSMRAEANLLGGVKSGTTVPVECGDDVPIKSNPPKEPVNNGGTNTGGTGSQGGSGGTSFETGCTYKIIQVYHESSFYNARTGTYQQGEGYWTTTTVLECPERYNEYSSSDSDCPDPDDGEIPMVNGRPYFEKLLDNCDKTDITTARECMEEVLVMFRKWAGDEGKAVADLIEEVLATPGLTLGEADEVFAFAKAFMSNLNGKYTMAIFSAENIATILSFGITNNLGAAARETLKSAVARYASSTTLKNGITVLGKYPEYLQLAEKLGAKRFSIPTKIWNSMTSAEQWAANVKFLDRAIARGDDIILSNKVTDISRVSGAFRKELEYLVSKGYRLSNTGTRMIK